MLSPLAVEPPPPFIKSPRKKYPLLCFKHHRQRDLSFFNMALAAFCAGILGATAYQGTTDVR